MNMRESKEDYLERILMLRNAGVAVRAVDIANSFHYSKASVSIALKKLKNLGYVVVDPTTQEISMTPSGLDIARRVYEKHLFLTDYLIALGVNPATAEQDACKIEHEISEETYARLKKHFASLNSK